MCSRNTFVLYCNKYMQLHLPRIYNNSIKPIFSLSKNFPGCRNITPRIDYKIPQHKIMQRCLFEKLILISVFESWNFVSKNYPGYHYQFFCCYCDQNIAFWLLFVCKWHIYRALLMISSYFTENNVLSLLKMWLQYLHFC